MKENSNSGLAGDASEISRGNGVTGSSVTKLANSGILLSLGQILVAAGGWIYWLVISKSTSSAEVGHATTIYSLIIILTTIIQLGLEYPLLKQSHNSKQRILGTTLAFELAASLASIPFLLLIMDNIYNESLFDIGWLSAALLTVSSIGFVSRFALLGVSDVKKVLFYDIIGVIVKFVSGFLLVAAGMGAYGILISFLLGIGVTAAGTMLSSSRMFSLKAGDSKVLSQTLKDGLINTPSKLSRMFILSLSVMLLVPFGISNSDIGIFYIAVMISIAIGGLANSIAMMSIPASAKLKNDLSVGSLRLGVTLTAPVITLLLVAPQLVLSIIGGDYFSADSMLLVLAIGIIPSVVVSNIISKLNTSGRYKELIVIGLIQLSSFFAGFFILVPSLGVLGAAYSITLSFVISAVPALLWLEASSKRHVLNSIASIAGGFSVGFFTSQVLNTGELLSAALAVAVTSIILLKTHNSSIPEIRQMIKVGTKG